MKALNSAVAVVALFGCACVAGEKPTAGTVVSMQSVECGSKKEGKKKSTSLLCHQYVVRTGTTEYQIRQPKPSEQTIVPANTAIQFTLNKDKMKFKWNGKTFEYIVVGTSAVQAQPAPASQP